MSGAWRAAGPEEAVNREEWEHGQFAVRAPWWDRFDHRGRRRFQGSRRWGRSDQSEVHQNGPGPADEDAHRSGLRSCWRPLQVLRAAYEGGPRRYGRHERRVRRTGWGSRTDPESTQAPQDPTV